MNGSMQACMEGLGADIRGSDIRGSDIRGAFDAVSCCTFIDAWHDDSAQVVGFAKEVQTHNGRLWN